MLKPGRSSDGERTTVRLIRVGAVGASQARLQTRWEAAVPTSTAGFGRSPRLWRTRTRLLNALGSNHPIPVDAEHCCTTNRDLNVAVASKRHAGSIASRLNSSRSGRRPARAHDRFPFY